MRKKKALYNLISSFLMQLILVLVNFIIPKLIIKNYGSSINGLINSITQFLSYISLLESGVASVIQAKYYKTLAENDTQTQSQIYKESSRFFKSIGYITIFYLIALIFIYPAIAKTDIPKQTIVLLILIISATTFSQYFFGLVNQCLIQADQKVYVVNSIKIVANILNILFVAILTYVHASIFYVKGISVFVLSLIPVMMFLYTQKHYKIDKKIPRNKDILKDKWNGLGLHIAGFIHLNTDIVLLTIFSGVLEVSVYSVYAMIIAALRSVQSAFTNSVLAAFGNMIAKKETEKLRKNYIAFDHLHMMLIFGMFTVAYFMIIPFVRLYTKDVTDVNYVRPLYASILLIGEAFYCQRGSYACIISAAGHFKQTMRNCYVEAIINIVISLILVNKYGLIGVGIGTLIAMIYRAVDYIVYLSKHIVFLNIGYTFYKIFINVLAFIAIYFSLNKLNYNDISSIKDWIIFAVITTLVSGIEFLIFNFVFCNKQMKDIYSIFLKPFLTKALNKAK